MEIIIRIFFDIPHPFGPWSQLQSNLKVHDNCESLFICFFIFFICLARFYVQKDRQLFETLNDIFEIEEIKITYKILNFCQESSSMKTVSIISIFFFFYLQNWPELLYFFKHSKFYFYILDFSTEIH